AVSGVRCLPGGRQRRAARVRGHRRADGLYPAVLLGYRPAGGLCARPYRLAGAGDGPGWFLDRPAGGADQCRRVAWLAVALAIASDNPRLNENARQCRALSVQSPICLAITSFMIS